MEYDHIRQRVSALLKEIEAIRATNEKNKRPVNGIGEEPFEHRRLRLEEIKQELQRLIPKRI